MKERKFHLSRKLKVKRFVRKPSKKLKAGQKLPPKHSGSVKKLVKKAVKEKPDIYLTAAEHMGTFPKDTWFFEDALYAMSAVTALTAQNTTGVTGIMEVTPEFLGRELDSIFTDIYPDAVKIGMVLSAGLIKTISERLKFYNAKHCCGSSNGFYEWFKTTSG